MCKVFVVEYHDQVFKLWQEQRLTSRKVLHLDFHCDLRGLLIDREAQHAFRIWDRFPNLDEGNFLTHAVLSGIITGVRWVHDQPGGREYDLKTVKYRTDLTALGHRLMLFVRKDQGVPLQYEVLPQSRWTGLQPGELLDIDWDFFASQEYPVDSIQQRLDEFFGKDFSHRPEHVYVCYSPGYSHPTRDLFRSFVGQLAELFEAEVVDVPGSQPTPSYRPDGLAKVPRALVSTARTLYHRLGLALRKRGIY